MPRAFIAIDISEAVRQKLVAAQQGLAATGAQLRLVEPENVHVTVKFLGDIQDDKVAAVADAIRAAVNGMRQFDITAHGIGAFPGLKYIRVVWAGVSEGYENVVAVQRNIDRELQKLGFPLERDFVPHLTLARVKSAVAREKLVAFVKENAGTEFGVTRAQAVELRQSTLTPRGPIYSTLTRIELA